METKPLFFILGLPRCRSAWLSVVCTMAGAPCTHEGMRGHDSFADYGYCRSARGDSDPTLCFWVPQILDYWPDARFVVIEREDGESLISMLKAAPEEMQRPIAANWHTMSQAFSTARDLLRGNPNALFVKFADLAQNATVAAILAHVGASPQCDAMLTRWQRLKVMSEIVAGVVAPVVPVSESPRVRASAVCDVEGLSAEMYQRSDFETVAEWWRIHTGQQLLESALPPLGVRVSIHGKPAACVWCYESFGVPVAEIVFPVTLPGLSVADARRAMLYAISCIIEAAGKGHTPEATFTQFRALCPAGLVKFLERLNFKPALTERKPMILSL